MKEIKLSQGKFTLVDDKDYEDLNKYKWFCSGSTKSKFYARRDKNRKAIYMHKIILGDSLTEGDHINGNTLDNRRKNLRIANHQQNMFNQKIRNDNHSGYTGVWWHTRDKKWASTIQAKPKRIWLGYFKTKKEAIVVYNLKAKELIGEYARLNSV